jgi:hypothetical protein
MVTNIFDEAAGRRSGKETVCTAFSATLEPPPRKAVQLLLPLKFSIPIIKPAAKSNYVGASRRRRRAEMIAPTCSL